jgi:tol-pal system protein YbgF
MQRASLGALLLVALVGCGASRGSNLDRLKKQLDELAQSEAESKKRIEELNNRIFLLEDRVDTSRVAAERSGKPPRLPVIRLRPNEDGVVEETESHLSAADEPEDPALEDDPPPPSPKPRSVVEDKVVTFRGAARQMGGKRPVLRLYGSSGSRRTGSNAVAAPLPGPDPSTVKEKLGVVPLPSRATVRRARKGTTRNVKPMLDYKSARALYESGKFSAAAEAFRTFVKRYTQHDYADNALYWLAECFYDMKNFRLALKMFRRVVEEYPTGNKAPDALLKMGFSYLKLKERKNARTILAQLVESFPKSQVARLASETLVKIR